MAVVRRLQKELRDIRQLDNPKYLARPVDDDNIFEWRVVLKGPVASPYEGGSFDLTVLFHKDYPFKPPRVRFTTRVYHPNVNSDGGVDLEVLSHQWSPVLNLDKVLSLLSSLLEEPNPDNPLEPVVTQQYKNDRQAFDATAREWTQRYARVL
jgi:ubiquitin-conjugating enzyme E2 D/E